MRHPLLINYFKQDNTLYLTHHFRFGEFGFLGFVKLDCLFLKLLL